MIVTPGDIALLPFPFTDLSARKLRPVLVSGDSDARGDFLAVQVTSRPGHPGAVELLAADLETGRLPKASFVRPEKLFTLHVSIVVRRDLRVSASAFLAIRQAVCLALGCERLPSIS